jgi:small GTP-binding protein
MSRPVFKVLVVGPRNVGKSSLVARHLHDTFEESYVATIGVDMKAMTIELPDGTVILSVDDLGGQQSFASLRLSFYQGAHHIILVYDTNDRETFDAIPKWFDGITKGFCFSGGRQLRGSLVANKIDLGEPHAVAEEEGRLLADTISFHFFRTSAKTGENVNEVFVHAASDARESMKVFSAE